jgi:hypothetical protein
MQVHFVPLSFVFIHIAGPIFIFNIFMARGTGQGTGDSGRCDRFAIFPQPPRLRTSDFGPRTLVPLRDFTPSPTSI